MSNFETERDEWAESLGRNASNRMADHTKAAFKHGADWGRMETFKLANRTLLRALKIYAGEPCKLREGCPHCLAEEAIKTYLLLLKM